MRILQLTPGTGNFHCGSCLRDNDLVMALRARGHEVLMVPLYLPLVTEDSDSAAAVPIFYGGINVYLEQRWAFFRKTPLWLDRLFNFRGLLRASARMAGMTSARDLGDLTLSMLRGEEGRQAKELEKLIAWCKQSFSPEIICLSNSLLAGMACRLKKTFSVPVVCTLQGEDGFLDSLEATHREQAWKLLAQRCADIDHFIAVSHYFGAVMQRRLGILPERMTVVYNGIRLDGFEPAASPSREPVLGYLARMHPSKGLATLIDAFIELRRRGRVPNLRLRVAGARTSTDESFLAGLIEKLRSHALEPEVEWLPNIDRLQKQEFLRSLSVLSVPATYGEAFGLYVLEALASGVPVVQPRHGAFPELLEKTGGGILCEPDDPIALANALEPLLLDPEKARKLGEQGRNSVREHFSVERMAENVEDVLLKVTRQASPERAAITQPRATPWETGPSRSSSPEGAL